MSNKSLILVIIQFTLFAYFIFSGGLIIYNYLILMQLIGFVISVWGILVMKIGNFNVQPEVRPSAIFKSNGPYKYIRNPMYVGIILFFTAPTIHDFSFIRLWALILLVLVFLEKIKLEEQFLSHRFGDTYLNYKKKTYRLIPFIY